MRTDPDALEHWLRPGLAVCGLVSVALGLAGQFDAIDIVSFVLLLAIAWLCRAIYDLRHEDGTGAFTGKSRVWLLMSLGFLYLAIDELFSIHEGIDLFIHWLFAMRETGLTDRIDDVVVLAYGILGVAVLWSHRSELAVSRPALPYLLLGFSFLLLMVALDALTNRMDFIRRYLFLPRDYPGLIFLARFSEELLKIAAAMCFLLFFHNTWRRVWNAGKLSAAKIRSMPG
jgi:hypothetical protein